MWNYSNSRSSFCLKNILVRGKFFLFSPLLILLFLVNSSSHIISKKIYLTHGKEQIFDVGFRIRHKHCGSFYHNNKEYFYFSNDNTSKLISINDSSGKKIFNISLHLLPENIEDISIKSFDTILILSDHTNHLYFINRNGEIWKFIDLNPYLKKLDTKNKYFLFSSMYQDFLNNSILYLKPYPSWKENNKISNLLNFKNYSKLVNNGPLICKVSGVFNDSIKVTFGADKIFSRFSADDEIVDDFPYYFHTIDNIFIFSSFNDSIYKIDLNSLRIKNSYLISSNNSLSIKRKPIKINDYNISHYNEILNDTYQNQGNINRVLYDNYKNIFYIFVNHEKKLQEKPILSLLIYSNNFKKLGEFFLDPDIYISGFSIVTKNGLLIFKKRTNENSYVFHRLNFKFI